MLFHSPEGSINTTVV